MDELLPILLVVLAIAILWVLLKFAVKLGLKIFTCGCLVILAVALAMVFLSAGEIPAF